MIFIIVDAYDRPGLLRDLASVLASLGSNILFSHSIVENGAAKIVLIVDNVPSQAETMVSGIPSIRNVELIVDIGRAASIVAELGSNTPKS